ncbi:MAG: hypothetical protein BZ138_05345 [Methanosphaera sp. rholeuAM270]|nr:MAG: hypothetical protein BZ138_05345 [Methanosphaera sp. rholeuAM270]
MIFSENLTPSLHRQNIFIDIHMCILFDAANNKAMIILYIKHQKKYFGKLFNHFIQITYKYLF